MQEMHTIKMSVVPKKVGAIILFSLLGLVVLILLFSSFFTIDEGTMGVKYQFGKLVQTDITPGLHMKVPFVQSVQRIDTTEQLYEADINAYTKDTQTVENLKLKLNYYYDRSKVDNLIRTIGIKNIQAKLVIPQLLTIVKNEMGQYRAEELVQNRANLSKVIEEKMAEILKEYGLVVSAFALENIDFENNFEEAVRQKVIAEQDALKAQNKTKEKEELAKQTVIEAQAQADAVKVKSDAEAYAIAKIQEQLKNNPQYLELEKIKKWDGKLPLVSSDGTPILDISKLME